MSKTRFAEFLALSVDPIRLFLDILRCITKFYERRSVFMWCRIRDITFEIKSSDVTFNAASALSHSIGKIEFSSTV